MTFKPNILYLSKISRIMSGNYPPIICYAIGKKNYNNTICDCKEFCKYYPGNRQYEFINNNYKSTPNII